MRFMSFRPIALAASLSIALLASKPLFAELPLHNVPQAVSLAKDLGRVNSQNEINLTVVLKVKNQQAYDEAVAALLEPSSPTYHAWFTDADFEKYAPAEEDFNAVKQELINDGFSIVSSDSHRYSIRVHGTVGDAENAFQTELHSFSYKGTTFVAHIRDAQLAGAAGNLVAAVSGLEQHKSRPQLTIQKNFRTGQPRLKQTIKQADAAGGPLSEITNVPLTSVETFNYTTPGASLPTATYAGTVYDSNPNLVVSYTPSDLEAHYGLTSLYKQGYNGKGQTIALVEAYGYADAESDANAAAQLFGLPELNSSNFEVIYPEGKPTSPEDADLTGWTGEIALDIQSAHAIAPGAKLLIVASAGQDNEDQIASLQYIIENKLAYAVSNSWENDDEILAGPAEEQAFNSVLEKGVAAGISFQFSTGDGGDLGLGTPVGAVGVPSNSPYATAVGGTSVLNNPYGSGDIVAGWGSTLSYIDSDGPVDPPAGLFYGGAGGGQSQYYAKPTWQKSLPGNWRQVPDVSALADPFTGFAIIYTDEGTRYFQAGVGGTSLASPIFTSIWAIADQYNGKPLGFASPIVATLKSGQITDVVPTSELNDYDPVGFITDSKGIAEYDTAEIFSGLTYSQTKFPAAIWPLDSTDAVALSFGLDSSLTVTTGWDNVTGFGEPNGLPFIQGVTHKTSTTTK